MIGNFKQPRKIDPDSDTLALTALAWLAGEEDLFLRFMALSGMTTDQVAAVASEPGFLGGVLDFLMGNETDLLRFSAESGIRPEAIAAAWHKLNGGLDSGEY